MSRSKVKADPFKKPQYLKWRSGRPRWEPGPHLRSKGWKGRDLKTEAGEWLEIDAAVAAARALNEKVEEWRRGDGGPKIVRKLPAERTCGHLFKLWSATPEFSRLAPRTREFYLLNAKLFLSSPTDSNGCTFADEPVLALSPPVLYGYWQSLYQSRGHHMANGIMATVRVMLTHARLRLGWIENNPARDLGLMRPDSRLKIWLPWQIETFVLIADEFKLWSVGDAVIAGLHSAQRQSDVLSLPLSIFREERIKLTQAKTRALVDAPMTHQMQLRVAEAAERRHWQNVIPFDAPLVMREDGEPYDRRSFNVNFVRVRDAAEAIDQSFSELKYLDLRDTAVTRLALASCTLPEISAISGHSLKTIQDIMKHYLVMQPEMADTAVRKLTEWMEREGISV